MELSSKESETCVAYKLKTDFQDGGQLGFPILIILATSRPDTSYQVSRLSVQEKKCKIDF